MSGTFWHRKVSLVLYLVWSMNFVLHNMSEDISGRKQEKEERQTEESRIGNEARRKRGSDIAKRGSRSARGAGREQRRVTLQYGRRQPAAERKVITGSKRINPGRAKTQGE